MGSLRRRTLLLTLATTAAAIGALITAYPPLCQAAPPAAPPEGFPSAEPPPPPFPATLAADDSPPSLAPVRWSWFQDPGEEGTCSTPNGGASSCTDGAYVSPSFHRAMPWLSKPAVVLAIAGVMAALLMGLLIWICYNRCCWKRRESVQCTPL